MPHMNSIRRQLAIAATASLAVALALGLAACGGSGSTTTTTTTSTSTSTSASATTPSRGADTTGSGPTGAGASRFKAMRECLQKNGITLPQHTSGQRPQGGPGGFLGGGAAAGAPKLPSGVSRAQYEAALKKCGGGAFPGRGARLQSPAFKQALTKFAACMRENGVNVPAPNTSGSGPIFDTKGIDTASSQFRTAESKCRSQLTSAFRRPGGATRPGAGAPPGTG
jgi:hypothetical protein